MKISIVIPSFNSSQYLSKTLLSIKKQNYSETEVIIVDGGSSDETAAVVKSYGSLVSRFVSEPDFGQLDAVQKGFRMATGDVSYWLNADDILMPETLNYVARKFEEDKSLDLIYSDDFAFDESKRRLFVGRTIRSLSYLDHVLFYRQMYSECIFWRSNKTKYLTKDYFNLRLYTDYAFFVNLREGLNELWVPKRLGAFRVCEGQASAKYRDRQQAEYHSIRSAVHAKHAWSPVHVLMKRAKHFPSFLLRQLITPQFNAVCRKVWRMVSLDRRRKMQSDIFFSDWLSEKASSENSNHEVMFR